jgi:ubiquinone/menaquinone biosynthesis C-methylase UbiE
MAERAHPDDSGFKEKWQLVFRRRLIPWFRKTENPYRSAFFWRYGWVNNVSKSKDVLDIPCGMGWGTSLIRGTRSLKGLDLSTEAIKEAKKRYGRLADFEVGDMSALCLPDASVDVVSCLEGIEHVPQDVARAFLSEAYRVLRSDGLLMISSPYCRTQPHSGNPYHIYEYQPHEIRQLISEFFVIEDVVSREVDSLTVLYLTCRKPSLNNDSKVA